jgi:hypothetical protein
MRTKLTAIVTSLLIGLWATNVMATEEPKYTVLMQDQNNKEIELREYAPKLIAEVLVEGDMSDASSQGFKLIADYIFGNNQVANAEGSDKIAMTAPVTVEPHSSKIAMTAPVTVDPIANVTGDANFEQNGTWRVDFVMPSQYTLANIPKPNNNAVKLREVPAKYVVALTYSGFNSTSNIEAYIAEALSWAQTQGLKAIGKPQLARYDPPWILPMFRRNEIMIEVAKPE